MNRRNAAAVAAIVTIALLFAGLTWAVFGLFSKPSDEEKLLPGDFSLLKAVPTDAALVFNFDGSKEARHIIADSTGVLRSFLEEGNPGLMAFIGSNSSRKTVVSFHNSGSLVPLVIVDASLQQDSLKQAVSASLAAAAGMKTRTYAGLLLASRSETLLAASVRHIDGGHSVLSSPGMKEACAGASGSAVVFINNSQASKLLQTFAGPAIGKEITFSRRFADWTTFRMEADAEHISLRGAPTVMTRTAGFMTAFQGATPVQGSFATMLPDASSYAIAVPIDSPSDFLERYKDYQDTRGNLIAYNADIASSKGFDMSPLKWYSSLHLKELACAAFRLEDGLHKVLLMNCGQSGRKGAVLSNPYPGFARRMFGPCFNAPDSLVIYLDGGWRVYGDKAALELYRNSEFLTYSLKSRLDEAGVSVPKGIVAYASFTDAPETAAQLFSGPRADALSLYVTGATYAPALLVLKTGSKPSISISLNRRMEQKIKEGESFIRDTSVVVPTGPYDVENYTNGKIYRLYQNKNMYICLNDDKGKGVWGIPFSKPVCGRVENIDFFRNGRKQFLFAAGSSLYILDLQARFVNGFPVDLGTPVRLGPALYDFDGEYRVMVLHKNNTLQMYDLKGRKPSAWKGIAPEDKIRTLPELLVSGGKRYWIVTTSASTAVYPLEGGEPLGRKEAEKLLVSK